MSAYNDKYDEHTKTMKVLLEYPFGNDDEPYVYEAVIDIDAVFSYELDKAEYSNTVFFTCGSKMVTHKVDTTGEEQKAIIQACKNVVIKADVIYEILNEYQADEDFLEWIKDDLEGDAWDEYRRERK